MSGEHGPTPDELSGLITAEVDRLQRIIPAIKYSTENKSREDLQKEILIMLACVNKDLSVNFGKDHIVGIGKRDFHRDAIAAVGSYMREAGAYSFKYTRTPHTDPNKEEAYLHFTLPLKDVINHLVLF